MRQFTYKHIQEQENQKEFLLPDLGIEQSEDKLEEFCRKVKKKKRNSFLFKESENALSQKGQHAVDVSLGQKQVRGSKDLTIASSPAANGKK